jgi:hypothetical protein
VWIPCTDQEGGGRIFVEGAYQREPIVFRPSAKALKPNPPRRAEMWINIAGSPDYVRLRRIA